MIADKDHLARSLREQWFGLRCGRHSAPTDFKNGPLQSKPFLASRSLGSIPAVDP